jgi:hypothetical protein
MSVSDVSAEADLSRILTKAEGASHAMHGERETPAER